MQLTEILSPSRTACDVQAGSKKKVLEKLSELLSKEGNGMDASEIFESLVARERLGSTALGRGVAIPHGRHKHGSKTLGAFIRTESGIDYDSADSENVDLFFGLLVPEDSTEEHLQVLGCLAQMFKDAQFREALRNCNDVEQAFTLLTHWAARDA